MNRPVLCAISPGDGRDLGPWIGALAEAGLPALLLREPSLDPDLLGPLVDQARGAGVTVWVHRKTPGHEAQLGHQGLHFPDGAGPPVDPIPWGISVHDAPGLARAGERGASWAFVSPVFHPTSKVDLRPTLGRSGVEALLAPLPRLAVYALGGITPERWAELPPGLAGAAVLGDLFGQPSPEAAAHRLRRHLEAARTYLSASFQTTSRGS